MNFNEKFHQNAYKFDPARWLEGNEYTPEVKDPYTFIPFSAGQRNCIGQHLAMNEARIIIALFIKRYDFDLVKDYKLRMTNLLLYEPIDPLKLILKPRKKQSSS